MLPWQSGLSHMQGLVAKLVVESYEVLGKIK